MTPEPKNSAALILVIEDEAAIRNNVAELLAEEGFAVVVAENGKDGMALAHARVPQLVICDIMLPIADGYTVLKSLRESPKTSHVPFIFLTARAERSDVRTGMNLGADDYLTKPFALNEVLDAVRIRLQRATDMARRAQDAVERSASDVEPIAGFAAADGIIVLDQKMKEIYHEAALVAASNINVLILGETGVGKEILARALHKLSSRSRGPMVALNCAALTETLLESELFGNERGAFTGAVQARSGLFETASRGTIFLDEVGELPASIQTKLLRVIEDRQVMRVGGRTPQSIDVRIVSATNRDLEAEVRQGRFREDLYYRLNGTSFTLPPLRERTAEIAPLVAIFVARVCAECAIASPVAVASDCLDVMRRYAWPGNLRELRNVVERAVVLSAGNTIEVRHLPAKLTEPATTSRSGSGGLSDRRELLQREFETIERERIQHVLEQTGGNQTLAAELLGVSRRTLVYKLTALGMPRPRKRDL